MTQMGKSETIHGLQIAEQLRQELKLHRKFPGMQTIQKHILTAYAEGFRAGYWHNAEHDKLQSGEIQ